MPFDYDVAIIGTGTSAYTLAYPCREAGKTVAIIDSRPFGGTCAMRGCQPKKYLVTASEVVARASKMQRIGIKGIPEIDWPALIRSKNAFTDDIPEGTERGFHKAGMKTFHGRARFVDTNLLRVDDRDITAEYVVIATGARPKTLHIPGEDDLIDSEAFMELSSLPDEILFVGGGYISMEFAHVVNRVGAKATILQRSQRVLKHFDPDLVDKLVESSIESGISIETRSCVDRIEKRGERFYAYCEAGPENGFEADMVVHGAGRVPDLDDLALDAGGVRYSEEGVVVNGYMQSVTNPSVYAIGDAAATPFQLATTADSEGEVAAQNICHGNVVKSDYRVVPSVVFSDPPLCALGMSEAEARTQGEKIKVNTGDMTNWPSSKRIGQKHAGYKIIIDEENHTILGAHILGHHAEEVINLFALAMRFKLKVEDLKKMLWAYPTYVSDMKYMI
jgi:glutathione reductase (NADPH)